MSWLNPPESAYLQHQSARSDRRLALVGGIMALLNIMLAGWNDLWLVTLFIVVPTVGIGAYLVLRHAGSVPTRLFMGAAYMVLAATLIHEGGGMIELHFAIFVLLAFLILYRDWRPIVVAAAVIAVHHLAGAQAQFSGWGIDVFPSVEGMSQTGVLGLVLLHAVFVVVETVVLCWMAAFLRREANLVGVAPDAMAEIAQRMGRGDFSLQPALQNAPRGSIAAAVEDMRVRLDRQFVAVADVTTALSRGNLELRVPVDGLEGRLLEVSQSINTSCQKLATTLHAAGDALESLSSGRELARVDLEAEGELDRIVHAVNSMSDFVENLTRTQGELVQGVRDGRFEILHGVEQFHGFQRTLYEGLNGLVSEVGGAMGAVRGAMDRLADGDLSAHMEGDYRGGFAALQTSVNGTVDQLRDLLSQIQESAEHINTASSEIAQGNLDLSQRTEQQAASLEETAASMEELTSTVKQNTDSARQANQLASTAAGVAERGGQVVGQVVRTMSEIDEASKRVADIITTIDGIAFQTNILALNAAVEAARAGEQGRGFAVVASEVRALAQRAGMAAKEIRGLIDVSVAKVGEGSAQVAEAGRTISDLVTSVKRVTDIMAEISAASAEQSTGIEQVNITITQMDETTQQNAALVEEASAAAKAMEEQADAMQQLVRRFRL